MIYQSLTMTAEELDEEHDYQNEGSLELQAFRLAFEQVAENAEPGHRGVAGEATEAEQVKRNFFRKMAHSYNEWKNYQRELKEFPRLVQDNLGQIQDALTEYRLVSANLSHKAGRVDEPIWQEYTFFIEEIPAIKLVTFKRPLFLRSKNWLKDNWERWTDLVERQEGLLAVLQRAPGAMEFFNKMCILREQHRLEQIKRVEDARRVEQARQLVESAIRRIDETNHRGEQVTQGARVLKVEEARKSWNERLEDIYHAEKSASLPVEEVLTNIQRLQDIIQDAPVLARGVRAIEERFAELMASHDMLISLGKGIIPQNEIARASVMMHNEVPQLWTTGDFDELDRALQSLDTFISYYDLKVQTEISLAERRRPGLTRALAMNSDNMKNGLPQLITVVRTLIDAVDARDKYMRGHSEKVTQLALKTAKQLDWSEANLESLEIAALLHDVGKLSIPEAILTKTGPLTPHEWTIIQMHPHYSAQIIQPLKSLSGIVPWVYHHQERWDGSGYPDHLSKREIPMGSSIISVAEAFSAMTTDMPNREALTIGEALERVRKERGKQFHPEVTDAFMEAMSS